MITAAAAGFLGDGETEESDVAERAHDRGVDRLRSIPRRSVRCDLPIDEIGRQRLGGGLLVGEFEIHATPKN